MGTVVFMNLIDSFIHTSQLDVLGFHDTYRKVTIIFLIVLFIYIITKPIVKKLIERKLITLTTYILLSFLLLTSTSLIAVYEKKIELVSLTLLAIGLFGFCLVFFLLFSLMKQLFQRK